MLSITFLLYQPSREHYVFTANCPFCGAIYVETALYRGAERWMVERSDHCRHFRGINREDLVVFQRSRWEKARAWLAWALSLEGPWR